MGEAVRNGWLFIFFWRDEVRHPIGLCVTVKSSYHNLNAGILKWN